LIYAKEKGKEEVVMKDITRLLVAICCIPCFSVLVLAQAKHDLTGWEKGGVYDRFYDVREPDSIKGRVEDIVDITPLPGMAKGLGLIILDKTDNKVETVHLGPKDFVDLNPIGLRKGDTVKVYGVWATIGGKDVLMATKVKKDDDQQIKLRRSRDGMPWWSMSPEELAMEKKME
jgi:hypothetical protein